MNYSPPNIWLKHIKITLWLWESRLGYGCWGGKWQAEQRWAMFDGLELLVSIWPRKRPLCVCGGLLKIYLNMYLNGKTSILGMKLYCATRIIPFSLLNYLGSDNNNNVTMWHKAIWNYNIMIIDSALFKGGKKVNVTSKCYPDYNLVSCHMMYACIIIHSTQHF